MEKVTPKAPLTKMSLMRLHLRFAGIAGMKQAKRTFYHTLNVLYFAQGPQY